MQSVELQGDEIVGLGFLPVLAAAAGPLSKLLGKKGGRRSSPPPAPPPAPLYAQPIFWGGIAGGVGLAFLVASLFKGRRRRRGRGRR